MTAVVDPFVGDEVLPARTGIVVIGGGVIGVMAALALAERGIPVALVEKGSIAGEQSSRNWGWCRKMGRDPAELPLALESARQWEAMDARLGAPTGYRRAGVVYLHETPRHVAVHEAWLEHARAWQIDARLLTPDQVAAMFPGSARRWAGGLHTPSDGRAEPAMAVPAMAQAARRAGAAILTGCAVRGLDLVGGRVAGVVTERGRIACDGVILAAGAWSRLFLGNHGVDFPQLKILASVLRTGPLDGLPEPAVGASDWAFRKRLDGGYTVAQRGASVAEIVPDSFRLMGDFLPALRRQRHELRLRVGGRFLEEWRMPRRWHLDEVTPFERVRVLDPAPVPGILAEARANLVRDFPGFAAMQVADSWAGLIDATPDAVPVIGPVAALPGLTLASGFSGHGFGIGPGAGRLAAEIATGTPPVVDPAPFRLERFARAARPLRPAA
ncbi:NAD(P)/FAD-dependent oxidoreductase [Roseicella aquatilis]|uniref:FAD-binding oxidoreductase n=1 Tax=Roseicella aquatilis TaxID=2527868 RepID=A0A4R4DR70_9PROT|nr:FAD-binding oxidoreductase [Roseicella aquatilis]TCZ64862.1 FAD-binding oxidoreductase [Roseicella aquatilis]